jgi:replicative DNA helicase
VVSTEKRILAACLKSREAFGKITEHLSEESFTPYSGLLLNIAGQFYKTDPKADSVDKDFVIEKLKASMDNPSKAEIYVQHARECFAVEVSAPNIAQLVLEAKRKESAGNIAQKLANTAVDYSWVSGAFDDFKSLLEATDLEIESSDTEILHNVSVSDINTAVLNKEGLIKLATAKLTEEIDGGLLPGHHVVIFARPETGKTAFVLTCIRSLVRQKLPGIYFGNEDPIRSVVERFQGCLSGMPRLDRLRDPAAAQKVLEAQGYQYARFISLSPGSIGEIEEHIKRHKPKWIVVDQMRNLATKAENRTNQLETIATSLRALCKKYGILCLSVTQGGDSASNKLVLDMGDVDSSNTGIPAQADLMIGLGLNAEYDSQNLRMVSLCKNKLSGKHTHFPLKLLQHLSRLEDI